jgi:hypothetical protein
MALNVLPLPVPPASPMISDTFSRFAGLKLNVIVIPPCIDFSQSPLA